MPRRVLMSLLALILFLAVTETGLQLMGAVARHRFVDRLDHTAARHDFVVLCMGDSHTYGAGVESELSYPGQLQARLAAHHPTLDVSVVNRGVPGVNSEFVAARLEAMLSKYRPDALVIWVGTNNRWNSLGSDDPQPPGLAERLDRWLLHSKTYRLAKVLIYTDVDPEAPAPPPGRGHDRTIEGMPAFRTPGQENLASEVATRRLSRDVDRIIGIARSFETPVIFVTYPLPAMRDVNRATRAAADPLGVPVVPAAADFARAIADGHRQRDLIMRAAGPHPTGLLYGYVAESVAIRLEPIVAKQVGTKP